MAPSSCRVRDGEIVLPSSKAHVLPPKPSSSLSAGHSASDSMSSQDARVIEEDRPVGAWFKCPFRATPEIDRALIVRVFSFWVLPCFEPLPAWT
jgi:hypothetical protein